LYLRPERVQPLAKQLAAQLKKYRLDAVCGPLNEGAFVALTVAAELNVEFTYAERFVDAQRRGLYPVQYRLPGALREKVRGQRVAIVNDVINAGSAVRGTFRDLEACGARPVAVAALLVLGTSAATFASEKSMALESLETRPNTLWTPSECPLCASGIPLDA
jgi:orotate phosphoribosyltransferase